MPEPLQRETDLVDFAASRLSSHELRTAPRFTLLIRAAKLVSPAGEFLCIIRDASESGVNIRLFHPLPDEGNMLLELQNGDQHELELVWQDGDRAGLRFVRHADIARIIESPSRFARRPIRIKLEAPAVLASPSERVVVEMQNISQQGAQVTSSHRFAIDQQVELSGAILPEVKAKVRWRRGELFGLVFEDTFQFGDLARIIASIQLDQQMVTTG